MRHNPDIETVKTFYNTDPALEWERLELHSFEFRITKHYLDRYLRPEQRVLDIGGGPGRYALHLAEKGCDVTLLDLSEANVAFALQKAQEQEVPLVGIAGDARFAHTLVEGSFDVVLLMGPLYHLLEESDRIQAVESALKLLRPGGLLFASFISIHGGICFGMKELPEGIMDPKESEYLRCYRENQIFCGDGFTKACAIPPREILPFFSRFSLQTLHLLGQESITAPCEANLLAQPQSVIDGWLELALSVCEREDLLAFSEHLLYIGKKVEEKVLPKNEQANT